MAVPIYSVDLVDIDSGLAESVTGYVAYGGGGAGLGAGADFAMQGVNCVDKQITAAEKGILFNNGAGLTVPAGNHVFIWHFTATPGVTDSLANRGVVACIGSAATAFCKYHVEGKETFGAGGRVGKCYPIDPSVFTANTGASPYRTLVGSPDGTLQYFGSGMNTTAAVRSANMGLDATRYGTGAYIIAGDVATPATFSGFATENDRNDVAPDNNRWGVLTSLGGNNYELQGMFSVGQNSAGTPTQAYFKDSNQNINIADTVHSTTDFTQFVLDHSLSESHWDNINITALGTNNKGLINDIAGTRTFKGGSLTGFGTTNLTSISSSDGHVWRKSDTITTNGAPITGGSIEGSAGAVTALIEDDLNTLSLINFIDENGIHAVEMPTLIIADTTKTWNNTFDSATYAAVDGATGNEVIKCNVDTGFTLTINVASGASTPTINNIGGGTVSVVTGLITLKVTVLDDSTGIPIDKARVWLGRDSNKSQLINAETAADGVVQASIAFDATTNIVGWARQHDLIGTDYEQKDFSGQYDANGFNATVRLTPIN